MWCVTFKCLRCCRKADGTVLKSAAWINDEQRSWVLCYHGHYFFVIFSFVLTGLTLVSAPHLARSYHHLFALEAFEEAPRDASDKEEPQTCFACMVPIVDKHVYHCTKCKEGFCLECDLFIHDTLHTCPGCASRPSLPEAPS